MKKNKKIHSFRMNIADIEKLKAIAGKQGSTQIAVVEQALHQYYQQFDKELFETE